MGCEFQKDITFDEIEAGDVILIEYFSAEGHYLGDSRGTASYLFDGNWHFYDRGPLYRESGYRLFKVTDLDTPKTTEVETAELERLRKIEADLKQTIANRKEILGHVREQIGVERANGYYHGTNGVIELKEKVIQMCVEISTLEGILNGK